jgi:hypothetical protein
VTFVLGPIKRQAHLQAALGQHGISVTVLLVILKVRRQPMVLQIAGI